MLKKILIGVGVLVVIVVILVVIVLKNLDDIVKAVIEKVGTDVTGVDVSVGSVKIKLSEGSAAIRNLRMANPPGYSDEPMIDFGELSLKADFENSVIEKINVVSPHFQFEQKGATSNFQEVQKNIEKRSEGKPEEEEEPVEKKEVVEEEPTVIQIDLFEIKDARVTFISDLEDEPKELIIESLPFKNLKGTGEEIAQQLMSQLVKQIIKEVTNEFIKKEVHKAIGDEAGGLLKGLKKKD
jgi:hypothetical protein